MPGLKGLLLAVGVLVGTAAPSQAGFLYTLRFGEASVEINNVQYNFTPAEFSFVTEVLVADGQTVTLQPPGDLNGFSVTVIDVDFVQSILEFSFYPDGRQPSGPGEVLGFVFDALDGVPQGVGTYQTRTAWRWVSTSNEPNNFRNAASTGSLTIAEFTTVPEPSSIALAGLGVLLVVGHARRKTD